MARETTYAGMMGDWRRLLETLAARTDEEPGEEKLRQKLEALLAQCAAVQLAQAVHNAARQELTQQIEVLIPDGQRVATLLRSVLKERYGPRSERLAAFGIRPYRGRRKASPPSKAALAPAPFSVPPLLAPEPGSSDG